MTLDHAHEGSVSDEVRHVFCARAETRPIRAGDTHIGIELRVTTGSTSQTLGRRGGVHAIVALVKGRQMPKKHASAKRPAGRDAALTHKTH